MKKSDWQYLIDTLLFLCICGISFIGILMAFFLAEGPSAQESKKYLLGLHRHQWGGIHTYLSLAFILLVLIHLLLSWSWIKGKAKALFKGGWAVVLMLTVISACLVIVLFWIFTPKYSQKYADYGSRSGRSSIQPSLLEETADLDSASVAITGKMTIQEVEKMTGVPSAEIIAAMGMPPSVSREETLGQLRKQYGFALVDFRDVLTGLMNKPDEPGSQIPPAGKEKSREEVIAPEKETHQPGTEHEQKLTRGRQSEDRSGILITGRMTLREIQEQTGISARTLIEKLGLPSEVPLDERLGLLRRRYGISLQEARDIIHSLLEQR